VDTPLLNTNTERVADEGVNILNSTVEMFNMFRAQLMLPTHLIKICMTEFENTTKLPIS